MIDNTDMLIFWAVVLSRLLVPLLIPRYPLPAVLAALVLDGVDQTIFQVFTDLPLDGYQSYDKALDIYYLTIAYISTMRNWVNLPAFRVSRFLIYYRLVGVVAFELSHWLALRGRGWGSVAREFVVMAVVNLGLVYLADFLLRQGGGTLNLQITLFFVLLLTLIVTLYDRYHLVYQARFAAIEQ